MTTREVAVIGDRFMRAEAFASALSQRAAAGGGGDGTRLALKIRTMELPWPDSPMTLSDPRFPEIREFMGEPDRIAEFIGDAEALVNHLAR